MHRLLVLSCSQRKRASPDLLPAVERYDGPAFRVVRRFLAQHQPDAPDLVILSARFGAIGPEERIPPYDQCLTSGRIPALQPGVVTAVERQLRLKPYDEAFIYGGPLYMRLLEPLLAGSLVPSRMTMASGTSGRRLSVLHDWLYGHAPAIDRQPRVDSSAGFVLRGVHVALTAEEALDLARRALAEGHGEPTRFHSWYVNVDDVRVGPKWLVTQITGLGPDRFATRDACRLLACLGILVQRR